MERLLERVWADRLPRRARATLSTYLSRLRHLLAAGADVQLTRRAAGYRLAVAPRAVDLHLFRELARQAHRADPAAAAELLAEALALWRAEPFAALSTPWLDAVRAGLEAERYAARGSSRKAHCRCRERTTARSDDEVDTGRLARYSLGSPSTVLSTDDVVGWSRLPGSARRGRH